MSRHFEVEDFSVSGPNHEEDVKRSEQNRLDAEKIASQNVRCVAVLFKTLKVDKVERFFRHRHTKGLVNFGSFSPIESFGRGEKAPAVVSTSRFRVARGGP